MYCTIPRKEGCIRSNVLVHENVNVNQQHSKVYSKVKLGVVKLHLSQKGDQYFKDINQQFGCKLDLLFPPNR